MYQKELKMIRILFLQNLLKIKNTYKHLGFKRFFKKIIYQKQIEIYIEKYLDTEQNFTLNNKLIVENLEESHLSDLKEICIEDGVAGRDPERTFRKYLGNNCNGFIAKQNNKVIGHIWWCNHKMKFDLKDINLKYVRDTISLKKDEIYSFDYFISSKYRGNGNALEFLCKVLVKLKKLGFIRVVGFVDSTNIPARWTYQISGFKEFKRVEVRRFFLFVVFKDMAIYFDNYGYKKLE